MTNWRICTWQRPADISGQHREHEGFSIHYEVDVFLSPLLRMTPSLSRSWPPRPWSTCAVTKIVMSSSPVFWRTSGVPWPPSPVPVYPPRTPSCQKPPIFAFTPLPPKSSTRTADGAQARPGSSSSSNATHPVPHCIRFCPDLVFGGVLREARWRTTSQIWAAALSGSLSCCHLHLKGYKNPRTFHSNNGSGT